MAYKIIVQDGNVLYAASNPLENVDFTVNGFVNVTKQVTVGDDPGAGGLIQTVPGTSADLIFRTNDDGVFAGNIKFEPATSGNILFNNVVWPDGSIEPSPGMYIGVTATNTLQFLALPSWQTGAPAYEHQEATAGQTVVDTTVTTLANEPGIAHLLVYLNGVKQIEGIAKSYQVTGPTQITFSSALALGDDVEFYVFL